MVNAYIAAGLLTTQQGESKMNTRYQDRISHLIRLTWHDDTITVNNEFDDDREVSRSNHPGNIGWYTIDDNGYAIYISVTCARLWDFHAAWWARETVNWQLGLVMGE